MDRRQFIRIIGGTSIISAAAPAYGFSKSTYSTKGVLSRSLSISKTGGWVLDTQFYQQMGGIQLLAHGMGIPVEDALTRQKFQKRENTLSTFALAIGVQVNGRLPANLKFHQWSKLTPTFGTESRLGMAKGNLIDLQKAQTKFNCMT